MSCYILYICNISRALTSQSRDAQRVISMSHTSLHEINIVMHFVAIVINCHEIRPTTHKLNTATIGWSGHVISHQQTVNFTHHWVRPMPHSLTSLRPLLVPLLLLSYTAAAMGSIHVHQSLKLVLAFLCIASLTGPHLWLIGSQVSCPVCSVAKGTLSDRISGEQPPPSQRQAICIWRRGREAIDGWATTPSKSTLVHPSAAIEHPRR